MAESIIKGFLISKTNYLVFDEIITILTENGTKIVCLSKGSRKILSKNSRNLFLGSYGEFIIFQSRLTTRMSRLKKVHMLENIDQMISQKASFFYLLDCINKVDYSSWEIYDFYKNQIKLIGQDKYLDEININIILSQFISLHGIELTLNKCEKCQQTNNLVGLDSNTLSALCINCIGDNDIYDTEVVKYLQDLFKEKYKALNNYESKTNQQVIQYLIMIIKTHIGIKIKYIKK